MIINHNLNSMNAHRNMSFNTAQTGKAMEKLSSGLRINRAGDDAAGLAISEKMRGQIRGLDQASRNSQDGISMIQTAEGALNETHSILQRMRELSVQASSDTLTDQDSEAIGDEMVSLRDEIDRIGNTTDFNGKKLLDGSLAAKATAGSTLTSGVAAGAGVSVDSVDVSNAASSATFTLAANAGAISISHGGVTQSITMTNDMFDSVGEKTVLDFDKLGVKITLNSTATNGTAAGTATALAALNLATDASTSTAKIVVGSNATANETISIGFSDMRSTALNSTVGALTKTSMNTVDGAKAMTVALDSAIKTVSTQRSSLGAVQNRLEHTINNLNVGAENLQAAESRIRDVDMAKEMMNFTKNNILNQAAQAMMSQSNQQPQAVLQLLR